MVQTLCWDCAKACGGCSWSDYSTRTPVEGWNATENLITIRVGMLDKSYCVHDCPEFVRDATNGGDRRI